MNIVISGASGVIGSALVPRIRGAGYRVTRIVRGAVRSDNEVTWQAALRDDHSILSAADAVIHLGGEPVVGRWTNDKKVRIRASRIDTTRQLCAAIAALKSPPRLFLHASATGIYGNRGDEILSESSTLGSGFRADVCRDWEAAAQAARDVGIRVVSARLGIVLTPEGGALRSLLTPFRLGLGGPFGDGRQWWSWISLDDAVGALMQALGDETIISALNVVAPQPLIVNDFARVLGETLHRPARIRVPSWAIRAVMGEAGQEILLSSQRVEPAVLLARDYRFQHSDLGAALAAMEI